MPSATRPRGAHASAERIVIEQEQYPLTRTIWLDGRPMPPGFEPNALGFSWGRFEPDGTLVVERMGFSYTPWGNSAGLDSSERKHVVERYELSSDGLRLDYSHTLVDPDFLTAPVVETFSYEKIADRKYVYEACDVESASRPLQYAQPVPSRDARVIDETASEEPTRRRRFHELLHACRRCAADDPSRPHVKHD